MLKGKPNKETLLDLLPVVLQLLELGLLCMHLLVLCHIGLRGEVVKVANVILAVQLGHKGGLFRTHILPIRDLCEVLMLLNRVKGFKTLLWRVNQAAS